MLVFVFYDNVDVYPQQVVWEEYLHALAVGESGGGIWCGVLMGTWVGNQPIGLDGDMCGIIGHELHGE